MSAKVRTCLSVGLSRSLLKLVFPQYNLVDGLYGLYGLGLVWDPSQHVKRVIVLLVIAFVELLDPQSL